MGAEQSAPAAVDDAAAAQPDAAAQKAKPLFPFNSKTAVTTVDPGPAVAPLPPPRRYSRSQATTDAKAAAPAQADDDPSGWYPCADGGFVRRRVDDLNQADAPRQWQAALTRAMASATASTTIDALIDAAVTSSVVTAALRKAADDQRALQATVEELQSKEAAMMEQMGALIQKNAQLRMECKISEQGRKSAEQEHERVSGRLEELQESMLWNGADEETAVSQPPVQRPEPSGAASRIIAARRSSGRVSPTAAPPADARPRSPPPQQPQQPPQPPQKPSPPSKPSTPDADAAETASPRRTSSMRAMFSRRSRSSRRQEG